MTEIYVKSQAYDGQAFCVVGVNEDKKSVRLHDISFMGDIRMRGQSIPITGWDAHYQMMLYGMIWGVLEAPKDDELDIYIHSGVVADWINNGTEAPAIYGVLLGKLRQMLIGRKVMVWQVDFGQNKVMNQMLDRLLEIERLKQYA